MKLRNEKPKPIAEVVPPPSTGHGKHWIGSLSGSIEIVGDVISPVIDLRTIAALSNR